MKTRSFEIISQYKDVAKIPTRATKASAGYDFTTIEDVVINPGETVLVKTGVKAYMLEDEVLKIYIRSSMATKRHLVLANHVGIIDADYYNNPNNEGHILIALKNQGDEVQVIKQHERICQGIFVKYLKTDDDEITEKRIGGFGSSNNR